MNQAVIQKNEQRFQNSSVAGKDFLSTRETAKMLGLSVGTVQKMADGGALEAWTTSGGHRRIRADSARAFLAISGQNRAAPAAGSRLSVLIAEDNSTQCKIYEASINGWELPIDMKIVPDGFAALIEAGRGVPDVMIIDLMMPGMDGFELIRRIRTDRHFDETDIMVVTGLTRREIGAKGGLPPDVLVIEKPVSFDVLHGFMHARMAAKLRATPHAGEKQDSR